MFRLQNLTQKTCEECERDFNVENVALWAYKLTIKGTTHWFCRWNCVRAAERRLKESKGRKWRKEDLKEPEVMMGLSLSKECAQGLRRELNEPLLRITMGPETMEQSTPVAPQADTCEPYIFPILTKEYAQKLRDEKLRDENLTDEHADPAPTSATTPRETINDIWRDLRLVVFKLESVYVSDAVVEATKLFRERLRDELADWVGEAR
jgi:hypothetical protein